jgi:hypothetical protein
MRFLKIIYYSLKNYYSSLLHKLEDDFRFLEKWCEKKRKFLI